MPSPIDAPSPLNEAPQSMAFASHGDNSMEMYESSHNIHPPTTADGAMATMGHNAKSKRNEKKPKRQYNKRNLHRPKRPLSAYNLFFRYERERIVRETLLENGDDSVVDGKIRSAGKTKTGKRVHRKTHGAIGFAELGRKISEAWKNLDEKGRAPFQAEADKEKQRYQRELGAMTSAPPNGGTVHKPRGGGHVFTPAFLEARDSSPSHAGTRKHYQGHPYDRDHHNGNMDMEEGYSSQHQYHGQYPPPDNSGYYDYYGRYDNNWRGAPPSSYPPHMNGSGVPPWNVPRYGSEQLPPNKDDHAYDNNPQQDTAQAFSPPRYQYNGYSDPNSSTPHINQHFDDANAEGNAAYETQAESPGGYAFQCEVCSTAVFSTFEECAEHEEECAKMHKSASIQAASEQGDRSHGNNAASATRYEMSPSPNKVARQQAVEAVMMLKGR